MQRYLVLVMQSQVAHLVPHQVLPHLLRIHHVDTEPRTRRTYDDTSTQAQPRLDWNQFNIKNSLRNLSSYDPAVVQKELRKLHLRWWHVGEPKMRTILKAAGLDEVRLNLIKPIVDTCREC